MDNQPEDFVVRCYCGKSFSQPGALSNHTRTCERSKKRLSSALTTARNSWEVRQNNKRQKFNPVPQLLDVDARLTEHADRVIRTSPEAVAPELV